MRREFISNEELVSHLRVHGIEDLSQVRRAYLELNFLTDDQSGYRRSPSKN
jgi:hypothetical protein